MSLFKKTPEEPREEPATAATSSPAGPEAPEIEAPVLLTPEQERAASAQELRDAVREARVQLGQGSVWLWQWHAATLRQWCSQGRRSDLGGLGAELGVWARGGVLAAVGYGGFQLVLARPAVLLVLGGVWVLAACRAEPPEVRDAKRRARIEAKQRDTEAEAAVDVEQLDHDQELDQNAEVDDEQNADEPPVVALIRAEIGADSGVHLRDLYPSMRAALPGCSQAPDEVLRGVLDAHHIRVRRSIRARGIAGRSGVHRADLPPLPSPEGPPGALSTPLSTHEDAGQTQSGERGGEQRRGAGSGPESAAAPTAQVVQDPDNPVRWHVIRPS